MQSTSGRPPMPGHIVNMVEEFCRSHLHRACNSKHATRTSPTCINGTTIGAFVSCVDSTWKLDTCPSHASSKKTNHRQAYNCKNAQQLIAVGCVCVTWALGREVCLPYFDHLRSRLITPPLKLLLTSIKDYYGSHITRNFHPPATPFYSCKSTSADISIVCPLDPVASLQLGTPTSIYQLCGSSSRPSFVEPK
jgi:hypothetical protein